MPASDPVVDADAYRLLRAGRLHEALRLAERAVADARVCVPGHAFLASILCQLGRSLDAKRVIAEAAELEIGTAEAYDGLAHVALQLQEHERANLFYRRATELAPRTPRYWYNLACSERSFGRLGAAEQACDRGIALDPDHYQTYLLRAELRVQAPDANHIGELEAALQRPDLETQARTYLLYALGKELDDVWRFDEAFDAFAAAARARRSLLTYDVGADEQRLRRIAQVFPRDVDGAQTRAARATVRGADGTRPHDDSRPIFIVGLPRSGTTLVERILSGLAGVRSNGETDNFSRALAAAAKGRGDMFERAATADERAVAANYARLAGSSAADVRVIEKLPTNYLYLGAIRRVLPNARIVAVRRSPLDSCFALFRTLFGEAYPFTYDFDELARYYAAYDRLMTHWRSALGDSLHEVAYEELVREPRMLGAAMARHCGLSWSDEAIDIQNNKSVSLTASAAQVRQPIYGSSTGRWRHYHRHLAPLMTALRRHGISVPEEA